MVECLPLAQGVILEFQDWVPHRAPCRELASPSAYVSASFMNKQIKSWKTRLKNPCGCTANVTSFLSSERLLYMSSTLVSILRNVCISWRKIMTWRKDTVFFLGGGCVRETKRNERMTDFENWRVFTDHQINFLILQMRKLMRKIFGYWKSWNQNQT